MVIDERSLILGAVIKEQIIYLLVLTFKESVS